MIDSSIILTFDGTIIAGLFVFYAFFVMLAERFDTAKKKVYIDKPIRFLAVVQLVFVISAMLVLFEVSNWALGLAIFGLFLLVIYSFIMIGWRGLIQT
jgi:ABC-type iron transport system FetAB permease component